MQIHDAIAHLGQKMGIELKHDENRACLLVFNESMKLDLEAPEALAGIAQVAGHLIRLGKAMAFNARHWPPFSLGAEGNELKYLRVPSTSIYLTNSIVPSKAESIDNRKEF